MLINDTENVYEPSKIAKPIVIIPSIPEPEPIVVIPETELIPIIPTIITEVIEPLIEEIEPDSEEDNSKITEFEEELTNEEIEVEII